MKFFVRPLVAVFAVCASLGGGSVQAARETLPLADAIAAALVDAGVRVAVHVPASGAVEVFDAFCDAAGQPKIYSYNEEAAYAVAHGAAIGGARAVAILKSHGLAKAANAAVDSVVAGNAAGFVVLVFHDATGAHSDTVFDTKAFVDGTKMFQIQPTPKQAYTEIQKAFETSERFQMPVAVLLDSDDLATPVKISRETIVQIMPAYRRDAYRYLLCPLLAPYQHRAMEARRAGKKPPADKPALPLVPDGLPPKFKAAATTYQPVFDAFRKIKGDDAVVAGDTGTSALFAFPPYDCIDVTTYYGGSIPLATGFFLSGHANAWAVCGDFAFIAAAHLGLPEALQRKLPLKVIVFHNGVAAATGGQPIQPDVFENVLGGYRKYIRSIRCDADPAEIEKTLAAVRASDRLEIVVVEAP